MSDGICHGKYGEAEGERDSGKADSQVRESSGNDSAAASSKDEPEGAETFGGTSFH